MQSSGGSGLNSTRKSPGFIWWRREPIGCRQWSCIIFYVCFSLSYSRIYLYLSFFFKLFSATPVIVLMSTIRCVYVFSSAGFKINVLFLCQFLSCSILTPKKHMAVKNLRFGQDFLFWDFSGTLLMCQVQGPQWTTITVTQWGQTKKSATTLGCTQTADLRELYHNYQWR